MEWNKQIYLQKNFADELLKLGKEHNQKQSEYFNGQKERYLGNFKLIQNYLNNKDVILDVGCCPAFFLSALKRIGYNVVGVDIDPRKEKEFIKKEKLKIKKCDIERQRIPYRDEYFDKVILTEVFEHLYVNPIFALKEIKRVLKKTGIFILTTPNGYSLKRIAKFLTGGGLCENPFREFNYVNELGCRGHIREYSTKELTEFLEKIGFNVKKVFYVFYPHLGLKTKPLLSYMIKLIYKIFPRIRSHLIIITNKRKNFKKI